jgi:hypothetical protein
VPNAALYSFADGRLQTENMAEQIVVTDSSLQNFSPKDTGLNTRRLKCNSLVKTPGNHSHCVIGMNVYKFFLALSFNAPSYKTQHLTFIWIFVTLVIWIQITSCSRISLHLFDSFSVERFTFQLIRAYRAACLGRITMVCRHC